MKKVVFFYILFLLKIAVFAEVELAKTERLILPDEIKSPSISKDIVSKIIPSNVGASRTGGSILSEMAENVLSYWWTNTPLRNSKFGQAADAVEKKARLQTEVMDENHIRHSFDIKILALQAMAKVEYTGLLNAAIKYFPGSSQSEAEISRSVGINKKVTLTQTLSNEETKSRLSFNYDW